jgi:hypothetical protein
MNYLITAYKKKEKPKRSEAYIEEFEDLDNAWDKRTELIKDPNYLKVRLSKILYEKIDM